MESPGEYLKRERELRGVSIAHIFEVTRVPLKYLEALEADNYEALPHPAFVKGFIRTYCKCLGVDENDAVLRYEVYMRESAEKTDRRPEKAKRPDTPVKKAEPRALAGEARSGLNRSIIFGVIGVAAVIVIYFVFMGGRKGNPPEQGVTGRKEAQVAVSQPQAVPAPDHAGPAPVKEDSKKEPQKATVPAEGRADHAASSKETAKAPDLSENDHPLTETQASPALPVKKAAEAKPQAVEAKKAAAVEVKAQPLAEAKTQAPAALPVKKEAEAKPQAAEAKKAAAADVKAQPLAEVKPQAPAALPVKKEAEAKPQAVEAKKAAAVDVKAQPLAEVKPQALPVLPVKKEAEAKPQAQAQPQADKRHTLSVTATETAWIKLRIDDGEPFDVLLRQGEGIKWKAERSIAVDIGNAGGVSMSFDGVKVPPLGAPGEVVHLKFPESLQDGGREVKKLKPSESGTRTPGQVQAPNPPDEAAGVAPVR